MSRHAYSIFCDDVREEISGKSSLIGVYKEKMLVNELPTVIPKLFVLINITASKNKPFKTLDLKVKYNDKVMFDLPNSSEVIGSMEAQMAEGESDAIFQAQVLFSPMHIENPGKISIHITADGKKIPCHGLDVELHSPEQTSALP